MATLEVSDLFKWMREAWFLRGLTAVFPALVTLFLFGGAPLPAAVFFAAGAAYGLLLFRVVSASARASFVMTWAFTLIFATLLRIEGILDAPMAGPVFMGFASGSIIGAYRWTGPRAGSGLNLKRTRNSDGSYPGGLKPALINASCAAFLLSFPAIYLLDDVAAQTIVVSLATGFLGGWFLFRYVKSLQARFITLLSVFLAFIPAMIVAGSFGVGAAPGIGILGFMAGTLIGGRYWIGPKAGAPRPPFAGQGKRRRRRKKRKRPAAAKASA